MARVFADENVSLDLVDALTALGHDVLTALDAGRAIKQSPTRMFWRTPLFWVAR